MLNPLGVSPNSMLPDDWHSSFTVWTTRVSNPVCYPHFRAWASVMSQKAAFAAGIPPDINEFHLYTRNSTTLSRTQVYRFRMQFQGWALGFHIRLDVPPAHALRPVIPSNACTLRITAAAGTELADAYSSSTVRTSFLRKEVYRPKSFIPHAVLLRQAFAHCGKFLTAASRRSLGRVSVPVWLIVLSNQLLIVALVSHYLTN